MVGVCTFLTSGLFAVTARQGNYPAVQPAAGGLRERQDCPQQQFQPICKSPPHFRKCHLIYDVAIPDLNPVSQGNEVFTYHREAAFSIFSSFSPAVCCQASICPLIEVILELQDIYMR